MAKLKSGTRIYGTATIDTSVVVGSAVTLSSSGIQVTGISTLSNANATNLQVTGISTFTNGPIFIGSGTSTGTALQGLQVTGGAYISTSTGIGTTNPSQILHVQGNARVTGAIYDSTNSTGTSGQVLQSTVTGTQWTTSSGGGTNLGLVVASTYNMLMP